MALSFTKMHGLGNDFVVLNALETPVDLSHAQLRLLADRRYGVGCDQILVIEPPQSEHADIRYRIFNADGSEVEHCGNGIRCVGMYLRQHGLIEADSITAETINGEATVYFEDDSLIRVDMGRPDFDPEHIPLATVQHTIEHTVALSTGAVQIMAVSMGNPHAVTVVESVSSAPVASMGAELQSQDLFPQSVNVGFMQILDDRHIRLRVFERGVGETLACGTGACAAVAVGIKTGKLDRRVEVELSGGKLTIEWPGDDQVVWMTGPATKVYEGQIAI